MKILLLLCSVAIQLHSEWMLWLGAPRRAVKNWQERSIASNNTAVLSAPRSFNTEEENKSKSGRMKTSLPYALGTTL
jgi:hypothetical protein